MSPGPIEGFCYQATLKTGLPRKETLQGVLMTMLVVMNTANIGYVIKAQVVQYLLCHDGASA